MSKKGNSENNGQSTAVTVTGGTSLNLPAGFAVRRVVTLPVLKLEEFKPRCVIIRSKIEASKYVDPQAEVDPETKEKRRAMVCEVADAETGEMGKLVVATVVHKNIVEAYPDGDYVGKCFYIEKLAKRPGKRYMDYKVVELDVPQTMTAAA